MTLLDNRAALILPLRISLVKLYPVNLSGKAEKIPGMVDRGIHDSLDYLIDKLSIRDGG